MRNIKSIGLLLLLPLLVACSQEEVQVAAEKPPVKVIRVEVQQLEPQDLVEEFTLPGSLEAWKDLTLAAEVSGLVEEVAVEEGTRIRKGQRLVRIDTLTLQANYDSAKSDFELREKTMKRLDKLHGEQLVSAQEYDNATSALQVAAATLRSAEIMLQKGRLDSPIDGFLEERFVEPGEYVSTGDPLIRVVKIDQLKVNVDVPEKDIQFLHKGDRVKIDSSSVNGWGYGQLTGQITHVGYVGAVQTRTYRVQIALPNPDQALRPGMIVRTRFVRRQLEKVLVVPLYTVVERDGRKYIFVKEGDLARQREVVLGATLDGRVVVRSGLQAGDEVIVKGQQLLIDSALVRAGGDI